MNLGTPDTVLPDTLLGGQYQVHPKVIRNPEVKRVPCVNYIGVLTLVKINKTLYENWKCHPFRELNR